MSSRGTQKQHMAAKVVPKWPQGDQKGIHRGPKVPQSKPKVTQGVPKAPKRTPKSTPKSTPDQNKFAAFSKLGFVHRRGVFKPPKPKVDYPYYVFGTSKILIFSEKHENTAPAMLLEHSCEALGL